MPAYGFVNVVNTLNQPISIKLRNSVEPSQNIGPVSRDHSGSIHLTSHVWNRAAATGESSGDGFAWLVTVMPIPHQLIFLAPQLFASQNHPLFSRIRES